MINVGDRVTIYFERVEAEYNVEVVRVPVRPHDPWELKRMDGVVVYVQTYSKMVRSIPIISKKAEIPVGSVLGSAAISAVKAGEGDKKP